MVMVMRVSLPLPLAKEAARRPARLAPGRRRLEDAAEILNLPRRQKGLR
jgi:hypothetical protein